MTHCGHVLPNVPYKGAQICRALQYYNMYTLLLIAVCLFQVQGSENIIDINTFQQMLQSKIDTKRNNEVKTDHT